MFCEKPIALDLPGTLHAIAEVETAGTVLQMGFQRRFDAGYMGAREAVRSGRPGRLHTVRALTSDQAPPPVEWLPLSGGLYRDTLIHDFDILRWVTGHEIVDVYAAGSDAGPPMFRAAGTSIPRRPFSPSTTGPSRRPRRHGSTGPGTTCAWSSPGSWTRSWWAWTTVRPSRPPSPRGRPRRTSRGRGSWSASVRPTRLSWPRSSRWSGARERTLRRARGVAGATGRRGVRGVPARAQGRAAGGNPGRRERGRALNPPRPTDLTPKHPPTAPPAPPSPTTAPAGSALL